ncbi:MAG: TIGR04086 family membrane protein [Thermaerobacter sp.]|nr:TIGR04086 family membrane protein [Thermaerobacter sp.]
MNLKAILGGAIAGLALALALAIGLAFLEFQVSPPPQVMVWLTWLASMTASFVAGMVAGRVTDAGGWLHGLLSGLTLNLVASVLAEIFRVGNPPHIWMGLGVAISAGFVGGMWGSVTA